MIANNSDDCVTYRTVLWSAAAMPLRWLLDWESGGMAAALQTKGNQGD